MDVTKEKPRFVFPALFASSNVKIHPIMDVEIIDGRTTYTGNQINGKKKR